MQVQYEFNGPLRRGPNPAALKTGDVLQCGQCEILSTQFENCNTTSIPAATASEIHMQAVNWGRRCDCPRVLVTDPGSGCRIRAEMGVRLATWQS